MWWEKGENQGPNEWGVVKLGDVCDLRKGLTYKSSDYCDESNGIVFLTLNCVEKGGGFNKEGIKYYKGNYKKEHLVEVNDIVIANTDLARAGEVVGAPVYIPYIDNRKMCMSMDLSCLKFNETEINKTFAYYFLQMHEARRFMKAYAEGSTVLHLDLKGVKKIPVSLPPLPEQRKIAEVLSTVDEAIEKTDAIIEQTQQLKKGLMQRLFVNKAFMVLKKASAVKTKLKPVVIKELGDILTGTTPSTTVHEYYDNPEYMFLGPADIGLQKRIVQSTNYISKEGFAVSRQLPAGAVMVVGIGATIGKVGITSFPCTTNQQINTIVPNVREFTADYLYYLLVCGFR